MKNNTRHRWLNIQYELRRDRQSLEAGVRQKFYKNKSRFCFNRNFNLKVSKRIPVTASSKLVFLPLRKDILRRICPIEAGVNPKAVFWLGIMFLMQISRLRFKQSRISMLISHIYVLGCFVNFLVIFWYIWREIVFLKGLVKLMEIGNFEDLLLF